MFRGRRLYTRILFAVLFFGTSIYVFSPASRGRSTTGEIKKHNMLDKLHFSGGSDKSLDPQRYSFLQVRMGREEDEDWAVDDVMGYAVRNGIEDYWERFQKPMIFSQETTHMDNQLVRSAIEDLLSLNGWVAAACPTLTRPFQQTSKVSSYQFLNQKDHLYYVAIVIHSADHFLVDQLAVIIQLAKRVGPNNIFVSMLDYYSTDATPTLLDLSEAVLTLLGVPFRIRRTPGLSESDSVSYYPMEEAHTRNLVLEPLIELKEKRGVKFSRVIWLKGFTCPNDILETLKVSFDNSAAMVCGMDWAEHNGFFIFSDRWRTRDIAGDQFRQSKSTSSPPPRDPTGSARYSSHLPFQVFCCESGTHIVDPSQTYYKGIKYRYAEGFQNVTAKDNGDSSANVRISDDGDEECMDSSQAFFCRDIWVHSAKEGLHEPVPGVGGGMKVVGNGDDIDKTGGGPAWAEERRRSRKRQEVEDKPPQEPQLNVFDKLAAPLPPDEQLPPKDIKKNGDSDANRGSDYDAMPDDSDIDMHVPSAQMPSLQIPNTLFTPARILVNPRCVTTYAGVSHTQLALDLFGGEDNDHERVGGKYVLDDWEGAPDSFVCQEQRTTGGRKATKTQRRLGFSIHDELQKLGENV